MKKSHGYHNPLLSEDGATGKIGLLSIGFRESRDEQGRLNFLTPDQEQAILESLPLVEVD